MTSNRPVPSRSRSWTAVLGVPVAAAVLVLGAGCSSGPPPAPPAASSAPAPAPAAPQAPAPAQDDSAAPDGPEAPVLGFGGTHAFPDGNAVTLKAPKASGPVPGAPFPRSLEVTMTVRNGTPAPEDLSRFGVEASVPEDREAPSLDDGPTGTLAPGEERSFPVRFALPDAGPTEVTIEVAKADQSAPGVDVPGSDEVPGTVVDWEGPV